MVRDDACAGRWYPSDRNALERLTGFDRRKGGSARFAVLPHAGLFFSHRGIAPFFERLDGAVTRLIILSPSHYYYLTPNEILTANGFATARTPFGDLQVAPLEGFRDGGEAAVQREHGVEMVLPFIARLRPAVTVSFGLISEVDGDHAALLADRLLAQMDGHTGVIASSDFTHYGREYSYVPYGAEVTDAVRKAVGRDDLHAASLLAGGAWREALAWSHARHATICGMAPASILGCLADKLGMRGTVADRYDSYGLTGGGDAFVDYATVLWEAGA